MTDSKSESTLFEECLYALHDADLPPEQKIPPSSVLLAFLLTIKQKSAATEHLKHAEIFMTELRKIIANPKPLLTRDIISSVQQSVDELKQQSGKDKNIAVLQFALIQLRAQLMNESQNN